MLAQADTQRECVVKHRLERDPDESAAGEQGRKGNAEAEGKVPRPFQFRNVPGASRDTEKVAEARGKKPKEEAESDPTLLAAHRAMLPQMPARKPGEIDVARLVAFAKLDDCTNLQQAIALLTRAEMMALLLDAHGLDRLAALDRALPALKNVK